MLRFERVSRRYGRARALDDVSFELRPGTLTALLGANGAGKTTLLRLAAGLEAPSSGLVAVAGADARTRQARRHVAHLAQDAGLYDELTARENLALVADFHGKTFAIEHAADAVQVADSLDVRAGALSRGQRQRVALARALLAGDLLLLDEPMTALDARASTQALDALTALHGARTLLVATHDPALLDVADRVLVLEAGRLVLDGEPDAGRRWMEAMA